MAINKKDAVKMMSIHICTSSRIGITFCVWCDNNIPSLWTFFDSMTWVILVVNAVLRQRSALVDELLLLNQRLQLLGLCGVWLWSVDYLLSYRTSHKEGGVSVVQWQTISRECCMRVFAEHLTVSLHYWAQFFYQEWWSLPQKRLMLVKSLLQYYGFNL